MKPITLEELNEWQKIVDEAIETDGYVCLAVDELDLLTSLRWWMYEAVKQRDMVDYMLSYIHDRAPTKAIGLKEKMEQLETKPNVGHLPYDLQNP